MKIIKSLLGIFFSESEFIVCRNCGYGNIKKVYNCGNCGCGKKTSTTTNDIATTIEPSMQKNIGKYEKLGAHKKIPWYVKLGLRLKKDEYVLIYAPSGIPNINLFKITKNGQRSFYDAERIRFNLNKLVITTKKIYLIATAFPPGWRIIKSFLLSDIKKCYFSDRIPYSPLFERVDRMTIETTEDSYTLQGLQPKKLFEAIVDCINKYK